MKLHDEEVERFRALVDYDILDTGPEEAFDDLARLAAYICKSPIAIISFVDENREWFKSIVGLDTDISEIPRDRSFGAYVINHSSPPLTVANPSQDERTKLNPLLNRHSGINYIAGVPLVNGEGHKIGTICVLGYQPRELSSEQVSILNTIARNIIALLENRRLLAESGGGMLNVSVSREEPKAENGIGEFTESGFFQAPPENGSESREQAESVEETAPADEESAEKVRSEIHDWIERLEKQNRNLSSVCEMDELMQASRSEEEVYKVISNYSFSLFPEYIGALYIYDESLNYMECVSMWGGEVSSGREFAPDECWGLRLGRVHEGNYVPTELHCNHLEDGKNFVYFCAPLLSKGHTIGLIHFERGPFTSEELDQLDEDNSYRRHIISTIAKLSGLALSNIKHNETLKSHAIYDSLTGLFNRRYMEETLKREISRVRRNKDPLGLIMVDIDHFKNFNDSYGHIAGDMLLRGIGEFFKESIRREDIACRFGGEEFVLILPGSSLENTLKRAEQIHEDIRKIRIRHKGSYIDSVQVSMGVVVFSEHGNSAEVLLESADKALYRAKSEGRNKIVVA